MTGPLEDPDSADIVDLMHALKELDSAERRRWFDDNPDFHERIEELWRTVVSFSKAVRQEVEEREIPEEDDHIEMREPDAEVQYVEDIHWFENAEDVKDVQFSGHGATVSVGITDESMVEFATVAEEVFEKIHIDMAEMDAIFHSSQGEPGDERDE